MERLLTADRELVQRIQESGVPGADKVTRARSGHRKHIHIDLLPPTQLT